MTNEEKILLAIGEIDDEIVAEASAPYKRKPLPAKQVLAVAASIAIVAVGITLLPDLSKKSFDAVGNAAAPEASNPDVSHLGDIAYLGCEDGVYRFILDLGENVGPIDVTLKSLDGSVVYTTEPTDASNDSSSDVEIRRPTITVNGVSVDALPTEPGEYEITISFDGVESGKFASSFTVGQFGSYLLSD